MDVDPETNLPIKGGSGAGSSRVGTSTAVPPSEARLVFEVDVTAAMREAVDQKGRHIAILTEVMGHAQGPWRVAFARIPARFIQDFREPIGPQVEKITYYVLQSWFLKVADERAMIPETMIAADNTMTAVPHDIHFAASSYGNFRNQRDQLDGLRKGWLDDRLSGILRRLADQPGGDTEKIRVAFARAERIADMVSRLDEQAMLRLIERRDQRGPPPEVLDFTLDNVGRGLRDLEREVEGLLSETTARTSDFVNANATLAEGIAELEGFDRAWMLKKKLEALVQGSVIESARLPEAASRAVYDVVRALDRGTGPRELTEQEKLRSAYEKALVSAGASMVWPEVEFAGRIRTFNTALGKVLPKIARAKVAELRSRIETARNRGYDHFEALYRELDQLIPKDGKADKATAETLQPKLAELERSWPMMGYPKLAANVLSIFLYWRNPKTKRGQMRRSLRFAYNLNSDLYYKWRRPALRAERVFHDSPRKAWRAEVMIHHVLKTHGLPMDDFRHAVALEKSAEVANDTSLFEWVMTILSIALAFVPGGAIVTVLRVGVAAYDAKNLFFEQLPEFADDAAIFDIGFTEREPSALGLYLAIVAHGTDIVELGKMMRISEGRMLEAIEKNEVEALFKQQKIDRLQVLKAYRKHKRNELAKAFDVAAGELTGGLGGGLYFLRRELAGAAELITRMGVSKAADIKDAMRVMFGFDVPPALYDEAIESAHRFLSTALQGTDFEDIFRAVERAPNLEGRIRRLKGAIRKRESYVKQTRKNRDRIARWQRELESAEEALKIAEALKGTMSHRIAEIEAQLRYIQGFRDVYREKNYGFSNFRQERAVREKLYDQTAALKSELKTLKDLRRGLPATDHGKHLIYEMRVNDWLWRTTGNPTKHKVVIEVEFIDGTIAKPEIDSLMLTETGTFRVYDAKWTHKRMPAEMFGSGQKDAARRKAHLRRRISRSKDRDKPSPQELAYPRLAEGMKIVKARILKHSDRRYFFGADTPADGVIQLENRVVFVLGDRVTAFVEHDLK